jgi:hypothetical protein
MFDYKKRYIIKYEKKNILFIIYIVFKLINFFKKLSIILLAVFFKVHL